MLAMMPLILAAIMGTLILSVDGSTLYTKRRSAQTAADAGMMAGIQALRVSGSDAYVYNTIEDYVTHRNGATAFVAYYSPDGTQVGSASVIPASAHGVTVTAFITFPLTFASSLGIDQASVSANAAGDMAEPYSLFAADTSCSDTINWLAGGFDIHGVVHSNNSIHIGGSNNTVQRMVSYVTSLTEGGHNNSYESHQRYVKSLPVTFSIDKYRSIAQQGTVHSGNLKITAADTTLVGPYYIDGDFKVVAKNVILNGLFYVTGKVHFTSSSLTGTFTVVSED